ncbi:MAG: protein kinase [Planctomycetota bacterium]|nr:protein kinase [Planctomycetota bacterium]
MSGNMTGASVANAPITKTGYAFLRYIMLPLGCGVRRKFSESVVEDGEKVQALQSIFQGSERLKGCIEEAFERAMQGLVIGLKSPWLMMETGEKDFTEDFREKVTIPFNQSEGLVGQLGLLFLDTFFLDYDTVADAIPTLIGHDQLDDDRFLSMLLSYDHSENIDDLAEAAWTELQQSLIHDIGLEEEHPFLRLGGFDRLLMDGVLTHVHEIIFENPAWSSLVDYLSEANIDADRIRAITTKDPDLSQQLTQEQLILDRVNGYRDRLGEIFENRGWLFDIADRLEDTDQDVDCELTGQVVSTSKIRIFVDKALEKIHERQGTAIMLDAAAALERPSKSAIELLRKARADFDYADWRDDKYASTCLSVAAAVWPAAGPQMSERYLRECIAFDPDNSLAHYNLYLLELHKERYGKALIHLNKAVELDPQAYEPFDLSRFTINRILGAGGTGVTFEVTTWDDRDMVVKSLWDEITRVDPRPALRSLQHIVTEPLDGTERVNYLLAHRKSRTYIVSDYVYGDDLETFRKARGGRIPILQVLEIGFRAAAIVAAAHERGLIHRNIKPENIRIGAGMEGIEVTLTDFAVPNFVISIPERVRAVRRFACWSRLGRKIAEAVAGYVAPEMLQGGPEAATEKSDLFALGASLYRLVTGLAPREFDVDNLPRELQTVISKCLHKDPAARPPSAKALARAFKKLAVLVKSGVTPGNTPSAVTNREMIPDIDDQLPDISDLDSLPDFGPPDTGLMGGPSELQVSETVRIPPGEDDDERFRQAFDQNSQNFGPPLTAQSNDDTIPIGPGALQGLTMPGPNDDLQDLGATMSMPGSHLPLGDGLPPGPDPFGMGAGPNPMMVGPGGALPSADPFNMNAPGGNPNDPFGQSSGGMEFGAPPGPGADPFGLSSMAPGQMGLPGGDPLSDLGLGAQGSGPPGFDPNMPANLGGVPSQDLATSDPFGLSDPGDPFGLAAPPAPATGDDPFGLLSQAPGVGGQPPGGVTDTLQALANTPANLGGSDPFGLSDPGDPFGLPGQQGGQAPAGEDPFGLVSGIGQGAAGMPGMPGMPGQGPGGDPYGLVSGVNNNAAPNPFGASPDQPAGNDPFGMSNSGEAPGGGLLPPPGGDPLAQMAAPSGIPTHSMEESAEEEPLDPMEALRLLEMMTGGPAPAPRAPDPAAYSDPVDLSNFGVGLDDPFGDPLSGDSFGGDSLGDDLMGGGGDPLAAFANDPLGSDPLAGLAGDPLSMPPLGGAGNDPFGGDLDLAMPGDLGMPADLGMPPDLSGGLSAPPNLDFGSGDGLGLDAPPSLDLEELALPPDMGDGGLSLPPDLGDGGLGDLNLAPPASLAPPPGMDFGELPSETPAKPKPKAPAARGRGGRGRKGGKGVDEEKGFGIVISGLGLKSKKEAAIKIIMEVRNLSEDEARDLCRSPVVPVLKRVSKDVAESAMARFKAAKINCRINKRRGRRR